MRRLWVAALLAALPACITFHDRAGVPVRHELLDQLEVGATTRTEVLGLMGPPSGAFDTKLLATVTRVGQTFDLPATPGRVDDEVLTWQEVDIRATVTFFPIFYIWSTADITSKTLSVFFDDEGRVRDVAYREDTP